MSGLLHGSVVGRVEDGLVGLLDGVGLAGEVFGLRGELGREVQGDASQLENVRTVPERAWGGRPASVDSGVAVNSGRADVGRVTHACFEVVDRRPQLLGALWMVLFVADTEGDGRLLAIVMNSRAAFAASWLTAHDGEERDCRGLLPGRLDEVLHVATHVYAPRGRCRFLFVCVMFSAKGVEKRHRWDSSRL